MFAPLFCLRRLHNKLLLGVKVHQAESFLLSSRRSQDTLLPLKCHTSTRNLLSINSFPTHIVFPFNASRSVWIIWDGGNWTCCKALFRYLNSEVRMTYGQVFLCEFCLVWACLFSVRFSPYICVFLVVLFVNDLNQQKM